MRSLEITTHIGCPVNCDYCPQKTIIKAYGKRSRTRRMTLETFKACLDKLPAGVDIHFTGMCEPWVNPQCTKMVLHARSKGHSVGVSTTLQGMATEDLELLKAHPYKFFSIHLPTENRAESIRIDDNYRALLSAFINSGFEATYHVQGSGYHPDLEDILAGHDVIVYNPHSRAGNVDIQGRKKPVRLKGEIGCSRGLKQNILLPNGDVLLCCMDYAMKHVIGNLVDMDLQALYDNAAFRQVADGLKDDKIDILCRLCEQYAFPRGLKSRLINKLLPSR